MGRGPLPRRFLGYTGALLTTGMHLQTGRRADAYERRAGCKVEHRQVLRRVQPPCFEDASTDPLMMASSNRADQPSPAQYEPACVGAARLTASCASHGTEDFREPQRLPGAQLGQDGRAA